MRCCEAWKPIEDCFDTSSFECVDFQRLSQIIAKLTRENPAKREAEITNLPWRQTEKDTALARSRGGQRAWRIKKPVLSLSAVTDERAILWKTKMNQKKDFVSIGEPFSKHVWKARDITSTTIFCDTSNKLLMTSVGLLTRPSLTTSLL